MSTTKSVNYRVKESDIHKMNKISKSKKYTDEKLYDELQTFHKPLSMFIKFI